MIYEEIANQALLKYDIEVERINFLTEQTNIFYEVITKKSKFVLKIFQEESSNINDNLAEHFFLSVIKDIEEINTPQVFKNIDGETITKIPYNNERGYKRTALYEYIDCEFIDGLEDLDYFKRIGKLLATLHEGTKNLTLPDYVNPKRFDNIFYYEGEEAVYKDTKYKKFITDEMIEILDELIPYINQHLSAFYDNKAPQLIHGDLNPWNIKIKNNKIYIFDFEEALCGLPIHDIAVFMYYYKNCERFNYSSIKEAFFLGYQSIRPLPENITEKNLELVMMARRINFFNYVLYMRKNPKEYLEMSFPKIKEYYFSYK